MLIILSTLNGKITNILLSVPDQIIKDKKYQQSICITLVDVSAAFDIIDHSIVLNVRPSS